MFKLSKQTHDKLLFIIYFVVVLASANVYRSTAGFRDWESLILRYTAPLIFGYYSVKIIYLFIDCFKRELIGTVAAAAKDFVDKKDD